MKILTEFKNAVKKCGKIRKVYLTTYSISVPFIETYVLPSLFEDMEFCQDIYDFYNLDRQIIESKMDIQIFYDFNMLDLTDSKKTCVNLIPIQQKNGVFHPKVIYLEGDKKAFLIVGSGNLTKRGWSENIEAFKIIEIVKNTVLFNDLNSFWREIFSSKDKVKYSTNKLFINPPLNDDSSILVENCQFCFSNKIDKDSIFLKEFLKDENSMVQIWSPYFSNDLVELHKKYFNKQILNLIPDFTSEDKIRINSPKELLNLSKNENIKFFKDIKKPEKQNTNHSKVWITGSKIAIGSYNFTKEALVGNNFEATLIFDIKKENKLLVSNNQEKYLEIKDGLQVSIEKLEDEKTKNSFEYLFTVDVDWDKRTIYISSMSKIIENMSIYFDKHYSFNLSGELIIDREKRYSEIQNIFDYILKNKQFSVHYNDKCIYVGIVNEIVTNIDNKPGIKIENIDELFNLTFNRKNEFLNREDFERIMQYREKESKGNIKGNNIDYFNIFSFFNKKLSDLKNIKENKVEDYCFKNSDSLFAMKKVLQKELLNIENHDLKLYLIIDEFNNLVNKIKNKEFKNELEIVNIKLNDLTKQDKDFINAFK